MTNNTGTNKTPHTKVIVEFDCDNKKYKLVSPTVKDIKEAKLKHSKAFTDALKEGFYTTRKLESMLSDDDFNLIKDHMDKRNDYLKLFQETKEKLDQSDSPEMIEHLASVMSLYREALMAEDSSMHSLYSHTCDQIAEDIRLNYLTYCLIRNEDGSPVWESYDDYEGDDFTFVDKCKYQFICWEFSLNPNWQEETPEKAAFKKVELMRKTESEEELNKSLEDSKSEDKKVKPKKERKTRSKKSTKKSTKIVDKEISLETPA